MLKDLAGTAALSDALTRTNELLAQVLAQLQETNGVRLEAVVAELRSLHDTLEDSLEELDDSLDDTVAGTR